MARCVCDSALRRLTGLIRHPRRCEHRSYQTVKPFLRQQLERYPVRLQELDFFLQQPEVVQDMQRFRALTREHAEVSTVAAQFERLRELEAQLASSRELLDDPDMAEMAREEIASIEAEL